MRHLAIDLDDVVLDFCGGLRDAIRKEYGVTITEEQMTQWDLHPLLDPIIGRSWWSWLREREWLWANFPAIDGAMGGLDTLRRQGFYLECVTSKPVWAEHNVYKWLGKWRPPFHRVTIVGPNHRKADYTDATILIDDKLENLVGFQASGKGRKGIMFDRPHNRHDQFPARVGTWPELVETLLGTRDGQTDG
jgi:5'(3')-deoxyribonucleotidase